jgi:hypothetical protein
MSKDNDKGSFEAAYGVDGFSDEPKDQLNMNKIHMSLGKFFVYIKV